MDISARRVYFLFSSRICVKQNRTVQQENHMAKTPSKSEVTSKKAATAASQVLRDPKSSAAAKSAAASALTQRPNKK
jgi:hypothetical protein